MTELEDTRYEWAILRTEYYLSGRLSLIGGTLTAAGILLGYALESSMKHLLMEFGHDDLNLLHNHNLPVLFEALRNLNALGDFESSNDFLEFANEQFKPRYPSLRRQVLAVTNNDKRIHHFGTHYKLHYDEMMYFLDQAILSRCQDRLGSVFFRAMNGVHALKTRAFLQSNEYAVKSVRAMLPEFEAHGSHDEEMAYIMEKGEKLWDAGLIPLGYNPENLNVRHCASYKHSRWETTEDGSIKITL